MRRLLRALVIGLAAATCAGVLAASPAIAAEGQAPSAANGNSLVSAVTKPQSWAPADIDVAVPATHNNVPCPLDDVLRQATARVVELVNNLQQFSATERVEHVEIKNGKPGARKAATFNYVVQIRELRPGMLAVEEYRDGSLALQGFPSNLVTTGTAAFALIFHPDYIRYFSMTCEGRSDFEGQPAWQIHFVQRPDRHNNFRGYRVANMWYPVQLKGRAWISAETYQVLRLETDLVEPIRAIPLLTEHMVIGYSSVDFPKRHVQLWLPENAEIYLDYRGHRYHHRHNFSHFQLFWVDTEQQTKDPDQR